MKQNTKENNWLGRSLNNYKNTAYKAAEDRGNGKAFMNAKTLTEARKLAFGMKRKNTK